MSTGQTHEGGAAADSNPEIRESDMLLSTTSPNSSEANVVTALAANSDFVSSGAMVNSSNPPLNVPAAPSVLLAAQKSISFDRQTPSDGAIPKEFNLQKANNSNAFDHRSSSTGDVLSNSSPRKIDSISFSGLSAENLAANLRENISNFKVYEAWIAEDVSGVAMLTAIAPSQFSKFLESALGVSSGLMKSRIFSAILLLMRKDPSLSAAVVNAWSSARNFLMENISGEYPAQTNQSSPILSRDLFATPPAGKFPNSLVQAYTPKTPAFMSQIAVRSSMMGDSMLFSDASDPTSSGRVTAVNRNPQGDESVLGFNSPAIGGMSQISGGQRFEFTIKQPGILPKYEVLENAKDPEQFYIWIRKYRRESLLCEATDRKAIRNLLLQDAKYEVIRVINKIRKEDPASALFDLENPFPKVWADVTDTLVLRVLFRLNGPVNVDEARERLKKRVFFFKDATTHQIKFTPKLQKFCNDFVQMIQDFSFNWDRWPATEELTPRMMKDAFFECFLNNETQLGPDGKTNVPKSSNLAEIRSKIKDYKELTLETIIEKVIEIFETRDIACRSNKVPYHVTPWIKKEVTGKKRQFNQMSSGGGAVQAPRTAARPPTGLPRCNNCGSKGHVCSERTCFLWGHRLAKGPNGVWPEGTKSLELEKEDYKAWKAVRSEVFYSYPENQKKPKPN